MRTIIFCMLIVTLGCEDLIEDLEEQGRETAGPCEGEKWVCGEDRIAVFKCEQGTLVLWDDCEFFGEKCATRNGKAKCYGGGESEDGDGGEGNPGDEECSPDPEPIDTDPIEEEPVEEDPVEDEPIDTDPDPIEEEPIEECLNRTVVVEEEGDLDELKKYRCLIGRLLIQDTWITQVDLGNLEVIYGTVRIINNARLVEVNFSGLESIVYEPSMAEGGYLEIRSNPKLRSFNIESLAEVSGVKFVGNAVVERLNLSQIETMGSLRVSSNQHLVEIDIQSLREVTILELSSNPVLEGLSLERLEYLLEIYAHDNASITEIVITGIKQDRFGHLRIIGNDSLRKVLIPGLTEVQGAVDISENPSLEGIGLGRLEETKRGLKISGNDFLQNVDLGFLEIVRQELDISRNETLPRWEDGQNVVSIASAMGSINLSSLQATGDLNVADNSRLVCDFQAVSSVDVVNTTRICGNGRCGDGICL